MCKLVMLGGWVVVKFGPVREGPTCLHQGRLPTQKAFHKAQMMGLFDLFGLKYLSQGTRKCLIYDVLPGPLDGDSTLLTLMNVLLSHANSGSADTEMGGAQGMLSRADLITQPFGGQSRPIFSQLFW